MSDPPTTVSPPMKFASNDDLQAFIAQWLADHGHTVYRGVDYTEGATLDILTQDYAIQCKYTLDSESLTAAATELETYQQLFPPAETKQTCVIAGLTPPESVDAAYATADTLKTPELEIWFVDQMPVFLDYYQELEGMAEAQFEPEAEVSPPPKLERRRDPWAGVLVALGMAGILAGSFALAYRILSPATLVPLSPAEQTAWEDLHEAIGVWDVKTAETNLTVLAQSQNTCVAEFANRLDTALATSGPEGFKEVNPIKRDVNQDRHCALEVVPYDFSP